MKLKMNKIWKLLVVALVITTTGYGQQRGQQGPPPTPTAKEIKIMVNELSDELSFSNEQKEQVLELYTSHFKEVESKTKSGRPDRNEMEKLKITFENNVKILLTKDQQKLFSAYQKKNTKKGKQ